MSWDFEAEPVNSGFTSEERKSIIHKLMVLLLVPGLQAIVVLTGIASLFWIAIEHSAFNIAISFSLLIMLLSLSIMLAISRSLLNRKKNGWSIMLIYTVYHVANNIFTLYRLSDTGSDFISAYQLIIYWVMTPLGAYALLLLNKKIMLRAFEVSRKRIENTWAIAIILPVVLFFIIYLYS